MAEYESFPTLMRKLTAGDDDAAAVFELYATRLIRLARKHIEVRIRSKVDQDDIAQSVFRTFFRRAKEDQFDLAIEDALWGLLAEIAVRKCGKWNCRFCTSKRSAARELPPQEPGPEEAVKDDRLMPGAEVTLKVAGNNRTLREVHLPVRKSKDKP